MTELPPETCPWSLSGPQFPQPTAIQQRYCYPKGRPEYSSQKGGALWTMYRNDGKEDLTYRLLHVYYSAKRAVNKGVGADEASPVTTESPAKRSKIGSPGRSDINQNSRPFRLTSPPRQYHHLKSPAITATTVNSPSTTCHSPLSFTGFPPLSPARSFHSLPHYLESQNFISPPYDEHGASFRNASTPTFSSSRTHHPSHSPLHHHDNDTLNEDDRYQREEEEEDSHDTDRVLLDPLPYDMESSSQFDVGWANHISNIVLKPSVDGSAWSGPTASSLDVQYHLSLRLEAVHESLCNAIMASNGTLEQQCSLVNLLASWARRVATDPLTSLRPSSSSDGGSRHNETTLNFSNESDDDLTITEV